MDSHGLSIEKAAELLSKSIGTVKNWRSSGIPTRESVRSHVSAFMKRYDEERAAEAAAELVDVINLEVSAEQFDAWNKAALEKGLIIRDWAIQGLDEMAKEEFSNITPMTQKPVPQKKAHTMAAAGSGLEADILDWDGNAPTLNVRVGGLSMFPTLNDDDVVTFRNKKLARSPFMKKGLIYLVRYKGEQMIKEYQTRKATPEEKDAPYLTNFGTVGVLVSHNPDKETYPDIDITDNDRFEWIAWLDR